MSAPPAAAAAAAKPSGLTTPAPAPGSLAERFAQDATEHIEGPGTQKNHPQFVVKPSALPQALHIARRLGFDHLADLTAYDICPPGIIPLPPGAKEPTVVFGGAPRIEVVYNLFSYARKEHLSLKVKLGRDAPEVGSAVPEFPGADWLEREVWDLLGVRFAGHPNLKRLLLPDGWAGHPLRKDYDRAKEQFVSLDEQTGEDVVSFEEGRGW
ncbi:MAG: NADH-quinone oxidoreductase subunit C [Halobacteriales archaeon]|nr:NADH-quinone oxidoreductase subunit C [Halobacteriales archaeon]